MNLRHVAEGKKKEDQITGVSIKSGIVPRHETVIVSNLTPIPRKNKIETRRPSFETVPVFCLSGAVDHAQP